MVFLFTAVITLIFYSFTFARHVTLVDSGELAVAVASGGTAHPPGFPSYVLAAQLVSLFPWGELAAKLAFFSSLSAAIAAGLVAVASLALLYRNSSSEQPKQSNNVKLRIIAVTTGVTFGLSTTMWHYATVIEVYTFHVLLVSAIWVLLFRCTEHPSRRNAVWVGLVFGLAAGVHHITLALCVPAFVYFCAKSIRRGSDFMVIVRWSLLGLVAGLLVYCLLPFGASRQAIFNWGNPDTLERFWAHVSAKQYRIAVFGVSYQGFFDQVKYFIDNIFFQFTPLATPLIALGMWELYTKKSPFFASMLMVIFFDFAYSANFNNAEDKDAYYLVSHLVLALALSVGLTKATSLLPNQTSKATHVAASLGIFLPLLCVALHYERSNKRQYKIAIDYVENALRSVPPGGLLLTGDWQLYSPYLYMRHVNGFRTDAVVIDLHLLRRTWYVNDYLRKTYPDLLSSCASEVSAYLEDLERFESGLSYDESRIQKRFDALLVKMSEVFLARSAVATTLPTEDVFQKRYHWTPVGLTMVLSNSNREFVPQSFLELRGIADGAVWKDEVMQKKVIPSYATMLTNRGRYLITHRMYNEAFHELDLSLKIHPEFDRTHEFLGLLFESQGNTVEAKKAYLRATQLNPENISAAQALAKLERLL